MVWFMLFHVVVLNILSYVTILRAIVLLYLDLCYWLRLVYCFYFIALSVCLMSHSRIICKFVVRWCMLCFCYYIVEWFISCQGMILWYHIFDLSDILDNCVL